MVPNQRLKGPPLLKNTASNGAGRTTDKFARSLTPISWKETRARLRADHQRLLSILRNQQDYPRKRAHFHPSFICVFLYRVSNHLYRNGHGLLARFIWHWNVILTGAYIYPMADLGEGLVVMHPPGTAILGKAGRNLTVMACSGLGGAGRTEDVGAGPDAALLGDDVILEPHSGILGPVRVGDRVRVSVLVAPKQDIPDDTWVTGQPPRLLPRRDL